MARLRGSEPPGERAPIPENLLRMDLRQWTTPAERARQEVLARTSTPDELEQAAVDLGVRAYRRWQAARTTSASEHGWSESEMYAAVEAASCRPSRPPRCG